MILILFFVFSYITWHKKNNKTTVHGHHYSLKCRIQKQLKIQTSQENVFFGYHLKQTNKNSINIDKTNFSLNTLKTNKGNINLSLKNQQTNAQLLIGKISNLYLFEIPKIKIIIAQYKLIIWVKKKSILRFLKDSKKY